MSCIISVPISDLLKLRTHRDSSNTFPELLTSVTEAGNPDQNHAFVRMKQVCEEPRGEFLTEKAEQVSEGFQGCKGSSDFSLSTSQFLVSSQNTTSSGG